MPSKLIDLMMELPDEIMLLVEHPSGVRYQNQVGGVTCWCEELEGVLAPIGVGDDAKEQLMSLPYPSGREGIPEETADAIDHILASQPATAWMKVDRARIDQSWEAWVYVFIDSPDAMRELNDPSGPSYESVFGFGNARGVLTWINSD